MFRLLLIYIATSIYGQYSINYTQEQKICFFVMFTYCSQTNANDHDEANAPGPSLER